MKGGATVLNKVSICSLKSMLRKSKQWKLQKEAGSSGEKKRERIPGTVMPGEYFTFFGFPHDIRLLILKTQPIYLHIGLGK